VQGVRILAGRRFFLSFCNAPHWLWAPPSLQWEAVSFSLLYAAAFNFMWFFFERSEVRIPVGGRDFSVLQSLQTGCGAHTVSYSVGTRVLFRG
jgi:hypothetical protein